MRLQVLLSFLSRKICLQIIEQQIDNCETSEIETIGNFENV